MTRVRLANDVLVLVVQVMAACLLPISVRSHCKLDPDQSASPTSGNLGRPAGCVRKPVTEMEGSFTEAEVVQVNKTQLSCCMQGFDGLFTICPACV